MDLGQELRHLFQRKIQFREKGLNRLQRLVLRVQLPRVSLGLFLEGREKSLRLVVFDLFLGESRLQLLLFAPQGLDGFVLLLPLVEQAANLSLLVLVVALGFRHQLLDDLFVFGVANEDASARVAASAFPLVRIWIRLLGGVRELGLSQAVFEEKHLELRLLELSLYVDVLFLEDFVIVQQKPVLVQERLVLG